MADRKRMSIGAVTPPMVGSRSSATTEREAGIAEVFGKACEEKAKAMYVTSITDRDLQGRPSFTEKDRVVLAPPECNEQEWAFQRICAPLQPERTLGAS
eukprot:g13251.t1